MDRTRPFKVIEKLAKTPTASLLSFFPLIIASISPPQVQQIKHARSRWPSLRYKVSLFSLLLYCRPTRCRQPFSPDPNRSHPPSTSRPHATNTRRLAAQKASWLHRRTIALHSKVHQRCSRPRPPQRRPSCQARQGRRRGPRLLALEVKLLQEGLPAHSVHRL